MVTYDDVCTAVVKNKIITLGKPRALAAARAAGLVTDDDGTVTGSGKSGLEKLVQEIKKLSGQVGVILARYAIKEALAGQEIDLPDNIK